MAEKEILRKGTEAYRQSKHKFEDRLLEAAEKREPGLETGMLGARVGNLTKELPLPFGCPDLEVYFWESGSVAYFCGRLGCLCAPLREDFDGDYPEYCPPEGCLDYGMPEEEGWDED